MYAYTSVRITAQLLTPLILCALIVYVDGGTYKPDTIDALKDNIREAIGDNSNKKRNLRKYSEVFFKTFSQKKRYLVDQLCTWIYLRIKNIKSLSNKCMRIPVFNYEINNRKKLKRKIFKSLLGSSLTSNLFHKRHNFSWISFK